MAEAAWRQAFYKPTRYYCHKPEERERNSVLKTDLERRIRRVVMASNSHRWIRRFFFWHKIGDVMLLSDWRARSVGGFLNVGSVAPRERLMLSIEITNIRYEC